MKGRQTIMEALRREEQYTIDDIYALLDGERAELIDGKFYNIAPSGTSHQKISIKSVPKFFRDRRIIFSGSTSFWKCFMLLA